MRLLLAVALATGCAACNQSDSGNVMGSSADALTPAQVDLALGPELSNTAGNQLEPSNGMNAISSDSAVEAADTEDALDESVADETADEVPVSNSSPER